MASLAFFIAFPILLVLALLALVSKNSRTGASHILTTNDFLQCITASSRKWTVD